MHPLNARKALTLSRKVDGCKPLAHGIIHRDIKPANILVHRGPSDLGRAVQVDPMKPKLKPPGTKGLKLKCDILPSHYAFKFNLRRYT
jgi:serine/threonine protein kinase